MLTKEERAAQYYEMYLELGTLKAVGEQVGLTRERVRQILAAQGYKTPHKLVPIEEQKARARAYRKEQYKDPEYRAKQLVYAKKWRKANPEKARAVWRRYYYKKTAKPGGLESLAKRARDWRTNNLERDRENRRKWQRANPEKCAANAKRYYEKKKGGAV